MRFGVHVLRVAAWQSAYSTWVRGLLGSGDYICACTSAFMSYESQLGNLRTLIGFGGSLVLGVTFVHALRRSCLTSRSLAICVLYVGSGAPWFWGLHLCMRFGVHVLRVAAWQSAYSNWV